MGKVIIRGLRESSMKEQYFHQFRRMVSCQIVLVMLLRPFHREPRKA
jgi:hypothetical protein